MADVLTPEQRRKNMRAIKSKDTKPEIILRKALWREGIRYRKNWKDLPGKPDIAITKYRIAVFCDSEFFHGQDWEELELKLQKSNNSEFWIGKIKRNIERDKEVDHELRFLEWTIIRFWSKDILRHTEKCVDVIKELIFEFKINANSDNY